MRCATSPSMSRAEHVKRFAISQLQARHQACSNNAVAPGVQADGSGSAPCRCEDSDSWLYTFAITASDLRAACGLDSAMAGVCRRIREQMSAELHPPQVRATD